MRYSKIAMSVLLAGSGLTLSFSALAELRPLKPEDVVDLSGTVSMSHKQYWQGGGRHHQPIIVPYITHGPGPYAADLLIVDENTGPQLDCQPYIMPPLGIGPIFIIDMSKKDHDSHGGSSRAIATLPHDGQSPSPASRPFIGDGTDVPEASTKSDGRSGSRGTAPRHPDTPVYPEQECRASTGHQRLHHLACQRLANFTSDGLLQTLQKPPLSQAGNAG